MPNITIMLYISAFLGCILATISICLALYAVILAKSLEKATHTVQFMPVDEQFSNAEDMDKVNKIQKEENEEEYRMI
tara:strand:+ start:815 stop:1045 length:231 start_codon:yes stop_codon:yes gene_type:complete